MKEPSKPIRWWPALVILAGTLTGLFLIWYIKADRPMQWKFTSTLPVAAGTLFLLLLWVITVSRMHWKIRVGVLSTAFVVIVGAALSLEVRGVTGDLLPILEFRWKPRHTVVAAPAVTPETNRWQRVSGEFLNFYGPDRNAALPGASLATNWSENAPKVLWRQPVGQAWSGFAVKDGLAITQEQREQSEYVVCYELLTGRVLWTHADEARYSTTIAGEGPRATPTIAGDRVYTFGATGLLNCLELETGKIIWAKDALTENNGEILDWGLAGSPLFVDDRIIISIGGLNKRSLVAYNADSGEFVWGSGLASADYSSPILATLLGERQVIIFNGYGVVANDLNGTELWKYPWRGGHPHITPPLILGTNRVLASSGYGTGAELLEISRDGGKWKVASLWKSIALKSKFGPLFHREGYVYGLDDGMFTCIELATGKRQWKDGRFGHGQGLLTGGLILLTSEKGALVLIQPDPNRLIKLATFPLFDDKTWNPPALAGEYLLVRNHKEAACVQLKLTPPPLAQLR